MNSTIQDSRPNWHPSAPDSSQFTELRMAVDQLWTKNAESESIINTLKNTLNGGVTTQRLLTLIGAKFGHTSGMPDFKGLNDDHDQRYIQKNQIASIFAIAKLNLKKHTETTIASGEITISQSLNTVDTEGDAASDDLETINGGTEGDILCLIAENDSRTVVIKHGTGNIYSNNAADFSLDSVLKIAVLIFDSTVWHMIQ